MSEREAYPSEKADKFLLRLPDGMRDKLKQSAKAASRTMNAEVVARLEESFQVKGDDFFSAQREMDLYINSLETQQMMLTMRKDMLMLRAEAIEARVSAISAESELRARTAKTDADVAGAKARRALLGDLERESRNLGNEASEIHKAQAMLAKKLSDANALVKEARLKLKNSLKNYAQPTEGT